MKLIQHEHGHICYKVAFPFEQSYADAAAVRRRWRYDDNDAVLAHFKYAALAFLFIYHDIWLLFASIFV